MENTVSRTPRDVLAKCRLQTIAHEDVILECWSVSGDADYLLRVVATDLKGFSDFLMHRLLRMPMVANVRSRILLEPVKYTTALPLLRR